MAIAQPYGIWSVIPPADPPVTAGTSSVIALVAVCAILVAGLAVLASITVRQTVLRIEPAVPTFTQVLRHTLHLRADDAQRERTVALLARHFADGRLSQDDYDERVTEALTARICRDLIAALRELPPLAEP